MLIDFNTIPPLSLPDGLTGQMYNDDHYRIIKTAICPGGHIAVHRQDSGDDMNYIISGTGVALCDGVEEELNPGVMHICPLGSKYSILNSGDTDLEMLTIMVKK